MDLVINSLKETGASFEVIEIDPAFSDTAAFCSKYGYSSDVTANTLLVASKSNPKKFCACVVLARTKLDVNHCVKSLMNCRVSFASAEEMTTLTGMEVGAVTPFGLSSEIPIFVDDRVMKPDQIILGAGKRNLKINVSPQAILALPNAKVISGLATLKEGEPAHT